MDYYITVGEECNRTRLIQVFLCILAVVCPQLNTPLNAVLSGCQSPFKVGSICQQQCSSGYYRSQGTDSRMCLRDGTWSGLAVVCSQGKKLSN